MVQELIKQLLNISAMIQCNTINQTINELLIAFADCNKVQNSDLRLLVELVAAVNSCANGGTHYDTKVEEIYEPLTDTVVSYPPNTFHAMSIIILTGTIKKTIDATVVIFPVRSTLNTEVTTLNQYTETFTVTAGSKVVVEYLIPTI